MAVFGLLYRHMTLKCETCKNANVNFLFVCNTLLQKQMYCIHIFFCVLAYGIIQYWTFPSNLVATVEIGI